MPDAQEKLSAFTRDRRLEASGRESRAPCSARRRASPRPAMEVDHDLLVHATNPSPGHVAEAEAQKRLGASGPHMLIMLKEGGLR